MLEWHFLTKSFFFLRKISLPNPWSLESVVPPPKIENNANHDLNYRTQKLDGTVNISFEPFRKLTSHVSSSSSSRYFCSTDKIVSRSRYSLSSLQTNLNDNLRMNLDILNNLRNIETNIKGIIIKEKW